MAMSDHSKYDGYVQFVSNFKIDKNICNYNNLNYVVLIYIV